MKRDGRISGTSNKWAATPSKYFQGRRFLGTNMDGQVVADMMLQKIEGPRVYKCDEPLR
ncbi:MAG: hypothetical protein AB7N80_13680 [Bdellovibrionales bacterium]